MRRRMSRLPHMAATPVSTTVTELPESRVRVDAEVPPDEVETLVEPGGQGAGGR